MSFNATILRGVLPLALAVAGMQGANSVYDFSLVSPEGKSVSLKTYQGKVLLIVNLASQTIYSDQVAKLDSLSKTYGPQGLVVLGIPSDDFGHGEPGKPEEVKGIYTNMLKASFPVFAKAPLTGKDQIPLYEYLTDSKANPTTGGELPWNFTKYLIGRDGKPAARYDAGVSPDSVDVMAAVENELAKKITPKVVSQ
ncbi:MAG: glutathione peroxidase [Bryobacteraceae bacterium]